MNKQHYNNKEIERARAEHGYSVIDAAKRLKVSRQTIYRVESGVTVSYKLLHNICRVFELPLSSVLYDLHDEKNFTQR